MNVRINHAVVAIFLASFFLLPGCEATEKRASTGAGDKPLRLMFISPFSEAKFFEPVKKGMNDAAALMDVEATFAGPADGDTAKMIAMVQQAVKDGYDGIALNIIDPHAFDMVVMQTIDADVPVVAFNVDDHATRNARLSAVNQHLYEAGRTVGEQVAPFIPQDSLILMTLHDEGVSALDDRLRGEQDVLRAKVKGIRWKVVVTGNDAVKGADVVARTLKANPDISIVLSTGQADTAAAGLAIEKHFADKGYWSAGFDLSDDILRLVKAGHIRFTIDQQPYIQGFYPVVQLTHYLCYGIVPSDINAGAGIIDRSNVDAVIELTKENYR